MIFMIKLIDRAADPMEFFGQVDLIHSRLPLKRQDTFRLLITVLGNLKFTPISVFYAVAGMALALDCFVRETASNNAIEIYNAIDSLNEVLGLYDEKDLFPSFTMQKKRDAWIKWQIFECVHTYKRILSERSVFLVGAYLFCLLRNQKLPRGLANVLFKLLKNGQERLSEQDSRGLLKLELCAWQAAFGNDHSDVVTPFSQKVSLYYRNKIHFSSTKTRQGVFDNTTYSPEQFKHECINIRKAIESQADANNSILQALAILTNLPAKYVLDIPLYQNATDDWTLVLDVTEGTIHFDLASIAPGGQKPESDSFTKSSKVLVKPLPEFLANVLREKLAQCLETPRSLGGVLGQNISIDTIITSTRFTNTFARFAAQTVDLVTAGHLANDFRSFPSSKNYYHQSSRQEVWDAAEKVFEQMGWGGAVNFVDGLNIGSSAVMSDHAITCLFSSLLKQVENSKPSNNCGIEKLIEFHQHYVTYCATMAIFCLSLRAANPLSICADQVLNNNRFIVINDKTVHGAASGQPITICKILRDQFVLYQAHCNALIKRLEKYRTSKLIGFLDKLAKIIDCRHVPLFISSSSFSGLSSKDVATGWPFETPLNFGRHYWASNFKLLGISDREISAHLRHQNASNLNWSGGSDLLLSSLIERVDAVQTQKMIQLEILPLAGLTRRLV